MTTSVRTLFEEEIRRRRLPFGPDGESGRYIVELGETQLVISLDNLEREVAGDGDASRMARFVDAVMASADISEIGVSAERFYWCLEPNDYEEKADIRSAVSDRVDRVLVHLSPDGQLITWVTPGMLASLGLSPAEAGERAFANLARALSEATVTSQDIDEVQLGFVGSALPFKSSLILAPNLRDVLGGKLGWPLLAVAPTRDFLYLWAARHTDFMPRVGAVVVGEHARAAYPVSTEVYEISDAGVRAIGEFPRGQKDEG